MDDATPFTSDVALTLAVMAGALALFVWGRLRLEVVGLLVLAAVMVLGLVPPGAAVSGFANEAVVTVALMLALSTGLVRTGAIDTLARQIERVSGGVEWRLAVTIVLVVLPVSAVINNTAAVAVMLPMLIGLARSAGAAPSRLLMPLSFASQLGGTLTLIGTSTNLLVAGIVLDLGLRRIGLLEITPPGLMLAVVGVSYVLTVGRWLTPRRKSDASVPTGRELREYLSELRVGDVSELSGRTVGEIGIEEDFDVRLVAVRRGEQRLQPGRELELATGDRLLVSGRLDDIAHLAASDHLTVETTASSLGDGAARIGELRLAEMMVAPRSRAAGRSLSRLNLRLPDDTTVLALERHGTGLAEPISEVELAAGDILLVRGPLERMQALHESGDLALLGVVDLPRKRTEKMKIAVPVMLGVVLLAATGTTTIMVAGLLGLLAMVLTGCVHPEEIYQEMDWRVVILLGSLLGLGSALERTGTADFLAAGVVSATSGLGLYGVLASIYLLTTLLTELITNNAAALVLAPIAVAVAHELGVSPMPFVVAVMFAASNSFATPVGYQTNTFIYGPGGYRFTDFLRVGGPLVLLLAAVATVVLPWFFPF